MKYLQHALAAAACTILVAACGGGGSGGSTPQPNPPSGNQTVVNPQLPVSTLIPTTDNTQTPVNPQSLTRTGLERLLGSVTFSHVFTNDTEVFEHTVVFDSTSYAENRTILAAEAIGERGAIACTLLPSGGYEFLCLLHFLEETSADVFAREFFAFDMTTNLSGAGIFEFCRDEELEVDVCIGQLRSQPDGTVKVAVAAGSATAASLTATASELATFEQAADAQFGLLGVQSNKMSAGGVDLNQQAEKLRSALQR